MNILSSLYWVRTQDIIFDALEYQQRYYETLFALRDACLTSLPEPRNFAEVTKLSENIKKPWIKATLKEINNLINNQTLLIEDQN